MARLFWWLLWSSAIWAVLCLNDVHIDISFMDGAARMGAYHIHPGSRD
jgi:hypothetical protein